MNLLNGKFRKNITYAQTYYKKRAEYDSNDRLILIILNALSIGSNLSKLIVLCSPFETLIEEFFRFGPLTITYTR